MKLRLTSTHQSICFKRIIENAIRFGDKINNYIVIKLIKRAFNLS